VRLYLVRHGKAEDVGPDGTDGARRLTEEGRRDFRRGAEGLASLGVRFDRILTSPLARARETAEILADVVDGPAPERLEALAFGDEAEILAAVARAGEEVALVGHEPTLGKLVSLAVCGRVGGGTPLRRGGVACIDFARNAAPGRGVLAWLLAPKQLRRLA